MRTRAALSGQAQPLTIGGASGYGDPESAADPVRHTPLVELGQRGAHLNFAGAVDLLQRHRGSNVKILAADRPRPMRFSAPSRTTERGEQVPQVDLVKTRPIRIEVVLPSRRRRKVRPFRRLAKFVVSQPFFRIFQHRVGFADLLEFFLTQGIIRYIRVILAGQLSICLLYLGGAGCALDAHGLVIILEFHINPDEVTFPRRASGRRTIKSVLAGRLRMWQISRRNAFNATE